MNNKKRVYKNTAIVCNNPECKEENPKFYENSNSHCCIVCTREKQRDYSRRKAIIKDRSRKILVTRSAYKGPLSIKTIQAVSAERFVSAITKRGYVARGRLKLVNMNLMIGKQND